MTKTFDDAQVASGTSGHTFTIDVANTGDDATNVIVTDTVDLDLSVTGASGTNTPDVPGAGWDCTATSGNAVSCTLASLAATTTAQVTVTYSVPASTAAGTIVNSASASSTEGAAGMDSESVDVVVAVLTVTKNFADAQVTRGTSGHAFTIDVVNTGGADATGVTVTDTVNPGLSVTGASGTGWNCAATSGNAISCSRGLLAVGTAAPVVTVTYNVPPNTAAGTINNVASVTSDQTGAVTDSDSVDVVVGGDVAGLSVTKSASSPAAVGSPLTYTIIVHNGGPSDATGVTMTDTLPSGVAFISASPTSAACTQASGRVTCTIGSLAADASATITVKVTPNAAGAITNTASVTGTTTDPTTSNNTVTVVTTVVAATHVRSVTLSLRGSLRAVGRVNVRDGFSACADSVGVNVQRRVQGHWTTLQSETTSSSGRYLTDLRDRPGKYRALAPGVRTPDYTCRRAVSPTRENDDEEHIQPSAVP